MRHLITLSLILAAFPAHAQDANRRAESEAVHYLHPCQFKDIGHQGMCEQNQSNFVEQYIYAKTGDRSAMGSTAASFAPRVGEFSDLGMPLDQVQSCAWRLVISRLSRGTVDGPVALDMAKHACDVMTDTRFDAAASRAEVLLQELNTEPAHTPPDDWYPHIPWIKVAPATPVDRSKLDSTVVPLHP